MDVQKLITVLKSTLDPNENKAAEETLSQIFKITGFLPALMKIIMSNDVEMSVRQAGAVYLKNTSQSYWEEREATMPGQLPPFHIHADDKKFMREHLLEATIHAPEAIRCQLSVVAFSIIRHDFPTRWPDLPTHCCVYLSADDQAATWSGVLTVVYQLVKVHEYKRLSDRAGLDPAINMLMPHLYTRCQQMAASSGEPAAVLLQKLIVKIIFALTQYFFPLSVFPRPVFTQWVELLKQMIQKPVPECIDSLDNDEKAATCWWKLKKWAVHFLSRIFERYGSPGNVTKEYTGFANWYLKTHSAGVIQTLLGLLEKSSKKEFVAPHVLQLTLQYLNTGVGHAISWKYMKPHINGLIKNVIFPLLCFSPEDQELWTEDPIEYVRIKFDVLEDYVSPAMGAETLIHTLGKKRKQVLQHLMLFSMEMIKSPQQNLATKDGALRIIGVLSDILLKKKDYKSQIEEVIIAFVFPLFQSEQGFLRARACFVFKKFGDAKFRDENNLRVGVNYLLHCLLSDPDVPVKVEAGVALHHVLTKQSKAVVMVEPRCREVILELLKILRETAADDLTSVIQKLVWLYSEQIEPMAVEITQHLCDTFSHLIEGEGDEHSDERAITAMGILTSIEAVLSIMEEDRQIMNKLEGIVLKVVGVIFDNYVMDFYEEVFSLIYSLTTNSISAAMWQVFKLMYNMFQHDAGSDYFTDMMPCLHNYVTVDPEAFLANGGVENVEIIYNMCKSVLYTGAGGSLHGNVDTECYAAKLLEVLLLQFRGRIDQCVVEIMKVALDRLTREVKTSELRVMCLQVVIAALYYNPATFLHALSAVQLEKPIAGGNILDQFITQWLSDTDCFLGLHDRKLCILGLCLLLDTDSNRPQIITDKASHFMPAILMLFDGLKRAYAGQAGRVLGSSDSEDDDLDEDDFDSDALEDDEDDLDDEGREYLERLDKAGRRVNGVTSGGDDDSAAEEDSDDDDDEDETALESFNTPLDGERCEIDEYQVFKDVMTNIHERDAAWYEMLCGFLTAEQRKSLQDVAETADKRRAARESRKIEQSGGYMFQSQTVPTSFNFSSPPPPATPPTALPAPPTALPTAPQHQQPPS